MGVLRRSGSRRRRRRFSVVVSVADGFGWRGARARGFANLVPGRLRDPTGRHDDRSAGSLLDWDRADRITPGAPRVPGSADLGLSHLLRRVASAACGAPRGGALHRFEARAVPHVRLAACARGADVTKARLSALRSLASSGET